MRDYILIAPILLPIAGALAVYLIGRRSKKARDCFADAVGICEFALCAVLLACVASGREYALAVDEVCGRGLRLKLDGFRAIYALIAAVMWMMTTVFSNEYMGHYRNRNRYYLFTLLTLGATVGVFLSNDLFTTFIFFEIMSFTSYVMVVQDEKPGAMRAGETYIAVAVIGGMVMLMGLFLLENRLGTLDFDGLNAAAEALPDRSVLYLPGALILTGFGAKAGMFPLHIWLPKAHPVAPAPASALLSGILTKAGVFGVLVLTSRVFLHDGLWGNVILALGTVTMVLGAVLAVFSVDLKRTLACSSMSQIGFILVGAGMQALLGNHNTLALWGTGLHMVNHSLIKLVLFMCAGVVYMNTHELDLNKIRGWGRNKPLLNVCFLMGALGIAGVPLWNGYVSKTLLHESIVEFTALAGSGAWIYKTVEWLFLISGGLTVAYMTKLYVAIFVEKPEKPVEKKPYMSVMSALAIAIPALILPVMGVFPSHIMASAARLMEAFMDPTLVWRDTLHAAVQWFSLENLKGALISISVGAAVYLLIIRPLLTRRDESGKKCYVNLWPSKLDLEELVYRPVIEKALPFLGALVCRILDNLTDWLTAALTHSLLRQKPIPPRVDGDHEPGDFIPHPSHSYTYQRISSSISYSLLLFGAGFCAAMVYLIIILIMRY